MNAERVGGVFWLIFGLVVMYGSFQLELGTLQAPGSGFLGFLAGSFVSFMAVIVLAQSWSGNNPVKLSALWKDSKWRKPATVALLIVAYVLVLERLGFVLTSSLLMFIMFKGLEKFSWPKAVLVTLAAVFCSYLLFHTLFKAAMPEGFFGF